ncbi:MAG TPA: FkbM family methyltransferase [Burkholderiales bacterium]|nr:FkbM family methyltransferase [Burkholderiales bacterium]
MRSVDNPAMLSLEEYEKLNPRCELMHEGKRMWFATPTLFTKWRVDSLLEKEPITLRWIAGCAAGEALVDVGANVGMYSIWAAKTRGMMVYAFEPEAQNYALLNRNIALNSLDAQVKAYCLALSDRAGYSELHLSTHQLGGSCHSLGERVDFKHEPMRPVYSQGCIAARLDDLVAQGVVPMPEHVKIDVDGFEPKVIAGARKVLADRKLRSLLIETNRNLADHMQMVAELESLGFRYDPAQVAAAERKEGPFKGVAEYVFQR